MTQEVTGGKGGDLQTGKLKLPIVCFSHMGWEDAEAERPRELLSRLALAGRPVFYFACTGRRKYRKEPDLTLLHQVAGVTIITLPYKPEGRRWSGFWRWVAGLRTARILARHRVRNPIFWFYHPLLFALGYSYIDAAIVYDVTRNFVSEDETQDDLYFEELALLAEADIVITDGEELKTHIRSMVADLAAGGTQQIPRTQIFGISTPGDFAAWDGVAANIDKVITTFTEKNR